MGMTGVYTVLIFVGFSYDSNSGGEREIQRTMLELLNQLDGFDSRGDVKVSINADKLFFRKNKFIFTRKL